MKTRKLLFTLAATMTMMFGLTLTAHAEEATPVTKVVGVEGIGTFTVPADWTEEYIDGYGTYWFNPTKTAYVALDYIDDGTPNPSIEALAAIYRSNLEAYGCTFIDWQITKYFDNDAVYGVGTYPGDTAFSADYPALNLGGYSCGYTYYFGNKTVDNGVSATTLEEFQTVLPILVTYQPAK